MRNQPIKVKGKAANGAILKLLRAIDLEIRVPGGVRTLLLKALTEVRRDALEEAAKLAEGYIDPEWPADDQSVQAKAIAYDIRQLVKEER